MGTIAGAIIGLGIGASAYASSPDNHPETILGFGLVFAAAGFVAGIVLGPKAAVDEGPPLTDLAIGTAVH